MCQAAGAEAAKTHPSKCGSACLGDSGEFGVDAEKGLGAGTGLGGAQLWGGSLGCQVKEFGICPVSSGELSRDF